MRFEISGMSAIQTRLAKLQNGLQNRQELIKLLGHTIVEDVQENIASEGKRLGVTWRPLTPTTNKLRIMHGYSASHPILIETGSMWTSIRVTKSDNNEAVIQPTGIGGVNPPEANILKATRHQYGKKYRKLPPRRFFEISNYGIKEIRRNVEWYIERLMH